MRQLIFTAFASAACLVGAPLASADEVPLINNFAPMTREGQIFTVRIEPASSDVKVFLTGNKVAQVNVKEGEVTAYVRSGNGGFTRVGTSKKKDYYLLRGDFQKSSELRVEVKEGAKQETFQFPLR